jgi:hypothetical protein
LKSLEVGEQNSGEDGYNAFNIQREVFAKFLESNNEKLRGQLEKYDEKNDAECDRRLLSFWFCLPDCERALNKIENVWFRLLLDTGASVSLLSESLFELFQTNNTKWQHSRRRQNRVFTSRSFLHDTLKTECKD